MKKLLPYLVSFSQTIANDFQAWTELGTLNLIQQNLPEAEKAYVRAIEVRPKFFLALMNLGKVAGSAEKVRRGDRAADSGSRNSANFCQP